MVVCTLPANASTTAVAEILFGTPLASAVQEGVLRLVDVFREVAVDYHRRRELDELRRRDTDARRFEQFIVRMHGRLQPLETAYAIANDGRTWIGCDRVSVAQLRGGRAGLLAVSGVDMIDPRAAEVLKLERLAAAVAASDETLY